MTEYCFQQLYFKANNHFFANLQSRVSTTKNNCNKNKVHVHVYTKRHVLNTMQMQHKLRRQYTTIFTTFCWHYIISYNLSCISEKRASKVSAKNLQLMWELQVSCLITWTWNNTGLCIHDLYKTVYFFGIVTWHQAGKRRI